MATDVDFSHLDLSEASKTSLIFLVLANILQLKKSEEKNYGKYENYFL